MADAKLKPGDAAPDFTLPMTDGTRLRLSALKGKKVVLYFYPRDDTPGCTKEACSFQSLLNAFTRAGVVILGVSGDDPTSHRRFAQKYKLEFPLLSDTDFSVCRAYGVYKQKSLYGRKHWGIERTTFLIGESGRIRAVFPKVKVEAHVPEVLHECLAP